MMRRGMGSRHPRARLGEREAEEILIALSEGLGPSDLARRYAVTYAAIQAIDVGRTWRHVRPDMPRRTEAARRPGRKPSRDWPSDRALAALNRIEAACFLEPLAPAVMREEVRAALAEARDAIDQAARVLHLASVATSRAMRREGGR